MELLQEMTRLQHELGYLSDETLNKLAGDFRVPLYQLEGLVSFYTTFRRTPPPRRVVAVCRDVSCHLRGCQQAKEDLQASLGDRDDVELVEVSCLGRCDHAPALAVNDHIAAPITLADTEEILQWLDGSDQLPAEPPPQEIAAKCDPYSRPGDHYGTARALADSGNFAEHCIQRLKDSGLRGMGGAGFPTGRKWEMVRAETSDTKYVICNADESEPGTFKDREILRSLPHLVLEGMLLGGLTIGAERGILFLRHEYEPERIALEAAIRQASATGALGTNAAGSGQTFDIEIFVSPGGYILGEETALLEALEDKRGEPRIKPPYPGTSGLWGKPTLINNVETFALASAIIHHGSEWWQACGQGEFAGLTFVSISGDIANPGVYEVPCGTTVRDLIELAGGMRDGVPLKAFLPGGASSNFLPATSDNTPLDFDAMKAAGSMLGTGAVIVINQQRSLFELAANLVRFFRNESCGKCVPCRVGSDKAVALLDDVQQQQREAAVLDVLPELGSTLEQTSICGLGQVALNPILSMMKHFPEEVPT